MRISCLIVELLFNILISKKVNPFFCHSNLFHFKLNLMNFYLPEYSDDYIIAGAVNGNVYLWSLTNPIDKRVFHGHRDQVTAVQFRGSGFYSCGYDGAILHWPNCK